MDPWKVMPAPHGPIYPWQESGKTEWQCVMILGVTHGGKYIFANVRDHRWLPVARPMPGAKRLSMGRDAGRCSVDRIVRIFHSEKAELA
jgi:hypothetical protein